ncbi:hypothetical protein DFH06DRAFT_1250194 [Mycena polygramma]|nr:hypothetical protein DFH06DRAFT_1250194 [Mycena polygramma]
MPNQGKISSYWLRLDRAPSAALLALHRPVRVGLGMRLMLFQLRLVPPGCVFITPFIPYTHALAPLLRFMLPRAADTAAARSPRLQYPDACSLQHGGAGLLRVWLPHAICGILHVRPPLHRNAGIGNRALRPHLSLGVGHRINRPFLYLFRLC